VRIFEALKNDLVECAPGATIGDSGGDMLPQKRPFWIAQTGFK